MNTIHFFLSPSKKYERKKKIIEENTLPLVPFFCLPFYFRYTKHQLPVMHIDWREFVSGETTAGFHDEDRNLEHKRHKDI